MPPSTLAMECIALLTEQPNSQSSTRLRTASLPLVQFIHVAEYHPPITTTLPDLHQEHLTWIIVYTSTALFNYCMERGPWPARTDVTSNIIAWRLKLQ